MIAFMISVFRSGEFANCSLELLDSTIYVDPIPPEPGVTTRLDWSRLSRDAWLAGGSKVDPAEVFQRLVETIDRYLEFPKDKQAGTLLTLATWVVMTYHYHAWSSVGYLLVNGPPASGKSTLFRLLNELCYRPFSTDNTSSAVVFRTLHSYGGTFLFDEAERLRDTRSPDILDINSILLIRVTEDGRDCWRLRFYQNKKRVTVGFGRFDESDAQEAKSHYEHLIEMHSKDRPPQKSTSRWLSSLPLELYDRLANLGLLKQE